MRRQRRRESEAIHIQYIIKYRLFKEKKSRQNTTKSTTYSFSLESFQFLIDNILNVDRSFLFYLFFRLVHFIE
jgi:hypothetical protein